MVIAEPPLLGIVVYVVVRTLVLDARSVRNVF
jgi:hypothetical protein